MEQLGEEFNINNNSYDSGIYRMSRGWRRPSRGSVLTFPLDLRERIASYFNTSGRLV